MKKFYIADLHFGHENIIRLNHRPFQSLEEMDETLISNWNKKVSDEDEVYILGDLIFKSNNPEKYLKRLKGKKYLITGNHDSYLKDKKIREYFTKITPYLELYDESHKLVLFHYPIREWNGYYRNTIHLYGHIHNNINDTSDTMNALSNCYNVGADCLNFEPKTLKEIIEWYS